MSTPARPEGALVERPDKFVCLSCGHEVPFHEALSKSAGPVQLDAYNLSRHPQHASAVGCIVAGWAQVEDALAYIHFLISGAPTWQAAATFYAIPNNSSRINVIAALTVRMVGRLEFRTRLLILLESTSKIAINRNKYAHGMWSIGASGSDA